MKSVVSLSVICFFLSIPWTAYAQNNSIDPFREVGRKILTESKVFPLIRTQDDGQNSPEPSVTLLATNDGAAAKARFGYLLKNNVSLDFTFTGPVSGGTAVFATQQGLGAGITAESSLRLVLYQKNVARQDAMIRMKTTQGVDLMQRQNKSDHDFDFDALVSAALDVGAGIQAAGGPSVAKRMPLTTLLTNATTTSASQKTRQAVAGDLNTDQGKKAFAAGFRVVANDLTCGRSSAPSCSRSAGRSPDRRSRWRTGRSSGRS